MSPASYRAAPPRVGAFSLPGGVGGSKPAASAPDLSGYLDDQRELGELLATGQVVALDRRGEAALRREAQLLERHVLRGLVDASFQVVLRFELRRFRRHEPEYDLLARRHEAQRREGARALVVELEEEAVDVELAEQRLRDEVVAAGRRP